MHRSAGKGASSRVETSPRALGTFHRHLAPAHASSPDVLARAFYGCSRVRAIVRAVAFQHNVADAFDAILADTCMACLPRLDQLDDPKNVYSVIWRTAENFAHAAWREMSRRDAAGVADDVEDLAARADSGRDDNDAAGDAGPLSTESPLAVLEALSAAGETHDARAAFRARLEQSGFPAHISRDLEDNLRGRRATQPRRRPARGSAGVVLSPVVLELRTLRAALGLTVDEMALRIGVPPARMYSYLRGIVKSEDVMNTILRCARELPPLNARKTAAAAED